MTFKSTLLGLALSYLALPAIADPKALLGQSNPYLLDLYERYPQYHAQLATFAVQQGFFEPESALATVVHELIHIDSARYRAFNVAGKYIAPYTTHSAWPYLNNNDVKAYLSQEDLARLGPIYQSYMLAAPNNRLGNVLDEINAYSQSIPFLCLHAPTQAQTHLQALTGHLTLVEFYLRILADRFPDQNQRLVKNTVSRGALETLVANAYTTLNVCFRQGIDTSDPKRIPKTATQSFASQAK